MVPSHHADGDRRPQVTQTVASFMKFQEALGQTGKDAEEFIGMLVDLSNYMERFDLRLPPVAVLEEPELEEFTEGSSPYRVSPRRRPVAKRSWLNRAAIPA